MSLPPHTTTAALSTPVASRAVTFASSVQPRLTHEATSSSADSDRHRRTTPLPTVNLATASSPSLSFPQLALPQANPRPAETISAVAIKLPAFWPGDPEVWFAQAEAQFSLRMITGEHTKFTHVVASLTKEYAMEVRDLLLSPPATRPYTTLRDTLIRRTSDSDSSKLQQLLSTAELGDRKPSQLLRDMERLVGGRTIDPGMFRQLFVQRLPKNVVMVLEATSASVDLATQAEIADKLMELNGPPSFGRTVSAVQAPPESSVSADVAALRAEVAALTETFAHWQPSRGRSWTLNSSSDQSRRRSSSRNRGQSPGRALHNDGVCYYHRRFGSAARKCAPPCAHPASGSTPLTSEPSGNATARN